MIKYVFLALSLISISASAIDVPLQVPSRLVTTAFCNIAGSAYNSWHDYAIHAYALPMRMNIPQASGTYEEWYGLSDRSWREDIGNQKGQVGRIVRCYERRVQAFNNPASVNQIVYMHSNPIHRGMEDTSQIRLSATFTLLTGLPQASLNCMDCDIVDSAGVIQSYSIDAATLWPVYSLPSGTYTIQTKTPFVDWNYYGIQPPEYRFVQWDLINMYFP